MYKKSLLAHYGTVWNVADKLGVTSAAVSQWGEVIPEMQALKVARLTRGKLKYDPELYQKG